MLTAPIAGFFALFWASVYLRDAAYRVGAGDSGNRMLAHVILVVVLYCLVAITQRPVGSPSVERVS